MVDMTQRHGSRKTNWGHITVMRSCKGWEKAPAQGVMASEFNPAFVAVEPYPLCTFLSGNFSDWCQYDRKLFQGVQEVLQARSLPMWGSCGGAQFMAIAEETGVDKPWDCPHCRDPKNPKLPIYTHINYRDRTNSKTKCGVYSKCGWERGGTNVRLLHQDPAFEGLPQEFAISESHCGQIEWPPKGWVLIVTRGRGGKTKSQCLRVKDRYIYAAQFHIDMGGENARKIMANFLSLAKKRGGYNPNGKPVPMPEPWPASRSAETTKEGWGSR